MVGSKEQATETKGHFVYLEKLQALAFASTQAIFQAGKQRDLIKESLEKPPLHAHSCRKEEVVISVVYCSGGSKGNG